MRKLAAIIILSLVSTFMVNAQEIDLKGALSFGTEVEPGIGLHLGGLYQLQDEIDLAGSLTFYAPNSDEYSFMGATVETSTFVWMLEAEGHYLFEVENEFVVYPLAGLNLTTIRYEANNEGDSNTELGLNIGGGAEYAFQDALKGFAEIKYVISDFDQAVINLGVLYTISN